MARTKQTARELRPCSKKPNKKAAEKRNQSIKIPTPRKQAQGKVGVKNKTNKKQAAAKQVTPATNQAQEKAKTMAKVTRVPKAKAKEIVVAEEEDQGGEAGKVMVF
jgi:hypothetical protein